MLRGSDDLSLRPLVNQLLSVIYMQSSCSVLGDHGDNHEISFFLFSICVRAGVSQSESKRVLTETYYRNEIDERRHVEDDAVPSTHCGAD